MPRPDENNGYVAMGVNTDTGLPQPLRVDPVTGELLIKVFGIAGPAGNTPRVLTDDNEEPTSQAVTDDANQDFRPLITESTTAGDLLFISY